MLRRLVFVKNQQRIQRLSVFGNQHWNSVYETNPDILIRVVTVMAWGQEMYVHESIYFGDVPSFRHDLGTVVL